MILLVFLLVGSVSRTEAFSDYSIPGKYLGDHRTFLGADMCYGLKSKTNLDLSGLGIAEFVWSPYLYCDNVTTVDLSNNWINKFRERFFAEYMPNLEHISLANNNLGGKGWKGAFRGLTKLKSLDLTHNPLSTILDNQNFAGLPNSCEIHVDQSKNFRTITPLAFGSPKKAAKKIQTFSNESRNCPISLSHEIEMFEVERSWVRFGKGTEGRRQLNDEPYSDEEVKMCMDNTTVRFVDFSNITDTVSSNCTKILINDIMTKLKIFDDTIVSFDSGWFRIRTTSLNAVYMYPKNFENLTRDLLNDLPENIRFFSVQESELQSLPKDVMINEHLRGLDLSANFIRFIEEGAFMGMNLTRLNLGFNPIVTLNYVPTLPETLLWLNLEYTGIREIPENTFSHLRNLLALSLSGNSITGLQPPGLDGLVLLQWLNLANAEVKNLRSGVFRNLSGLYYLDLNHNDIQRLEKGAFDGLGCLAKLALARNNLTRLDAGSFQGLTDSLEALDLSSNHVEILDIGAFVGAPKYNLSLEWNNIRRIGVGVFDLPYLRYLDLRHNNLTTIDKGVAQTLGNLADEIEVKLGFNPIERLDSGALAGLPSTAHVHLGMTPIKILLAGVFDDH